MNFEFNYGMDDFTLACPKCEFNRLEVICEDGSEKTILAAKPKKEDKLLYAFNIDGGLCQTNQFGTSMLIYKETEKSGIRRYFREKTEKRRKY